MKALDFVQGLTLIEGSWFKIVDQLVHAYYCLKLINQLLPQAYKPNKMISNKKGDMFSRGWQLGVPILVIKLELGD